MTTSLCINRKNKKILTLDFLWNVSNIAAYGRKCTRRGTRPSGLLISKFSKRMSLEEFLNLGWFESQNYASSIEENIPISLCICRQNKKIRTLDFLWYVSNIAAYGRKCSKRGTRPCGFMIHHFSNAKSQDASLHADSFGSQT